MADKDTLKNEAKELLSMGNSSTSFEKNIFHDKKANQFMIKLPKDMVLASNIDSSTEIKIVVNPNDEDFKEAFKSHFIIYGK